MALPPRVDALIAELPKVELHLHIEGTLEPEMVFAKAARHGIDLKYPSIEALRAAYQFTDLQSFLDIYYAGCDVLRDEQDFYDLAWAYLERAAADRVVHVEIFFDPQTHTARGVPYEVVHRGLRRALADGERKLGITSAMILCFLRHLSEEEALATLEEARPFVRELAGVGLDSGERGNPPSKFARVFAAARAMGLEPVAHAGEEGPAAYIREALDLLEVVRIDHGVRCEEDPALVVELARRRVPLTVCPLSNVKLCVVPRMEDHNLARLLADGLCVTVNSDDPAYFGGYIGDNYRAVAAALPIGVAELGQLARNAVEAAWLPAERKATLFAAIDAAVAGATS
ncbi:MAG TPA: adenosine deaminase [Kofleriaceae bacterium]|jgi:adenosine deaminase|nr:adenosine deaminase [Kofleriaceae bacterium]